MEAEGYHIPREELQSVQRELEVLSEQYSQKCLENAHLAQALEAERQALRQCQRENQELNAHNQVSSQSGEPELGSGLTLRVAPTLPLVLIPNVQPACCFWPVARYSLWVASEAALPQNSCWGLGPLSLTISETKSLVASLNLQFILCRAWGSSLRVGTSFLRAAKIKLLRISHLCLSDHSLRVHCTSGNWNAFKS